MDTEQHGVPDDGILVQDDNVPDERAKFRALILANPNYFGNVKSSPFTPVLNIQFNTFYEELGCVGFQPQFNRLDAVVYVNQPSGYGGDVCSPGTQEYVRFYLSGDNGASWQDAGLTSFSAFNIPVGTAGRRRLEYAVTLSVDPRRRFCFIENNYRVRAILSWNVPPPPDEPDFIPVWGNVRNANIHIDPLRQILINDVLQAAQVKLPPVLESILDLDQPVAAAPPKALGAAELQVLYQGKDVEPHRYALPELQQLISQPAWTPSLMASGYTGVLTGLKLNLAAILPQLFPVDGNTRYEELVCIGLNPNQNTLIGVIRVKLASGYSGGPCTAGSREYVTFWADFDNNGSFETCLGTTSVNVHDIQPLPQGGLDYSVFLPVNLDQYRRPCQRGPVVVPIRAILSWAIPAPCSNPNYVPVWGNREHTLIHIGSGVQPQGHLPFIETVGGMLVTRINAAGYANGPMQLIGLEAVESPFGGTVVITGHIGSPPDLSSGAAPLKYRVYVSDGGLPQLVTEKFRMARTRWLNGIPSFLPEIMQEPDADGWFTYQEDFTGGLGNALTYVVGNELAHWQTAGKTGTWQIWIVAKVAGVLPEVTYTGEAITVRLDNQAPQIPPGSFRITSGGGSCADFTIGDTIEGTYAVSDEHFGSLRLNLLPPFGGEFTMPSPMPSFPDVSTTVVSGIWKFDTSGLPRCGYVIRLLATDRTIVNSRRIGFSSEDYVGFCLKPPGAP